MRALIVYESMFGCTRTIAENVAAGMADRFDTACVPVAGATPERVAGIDLLVCGGPTHVHSLSRPSTRRAAVDQAGKNLTLELEPGVGGPGLREWLEFLDPHDGTVAAAFDTRSTAPAFLTGRASKSIARRLRRRGFILAMAPESFLVGKQADLLDGEAARAQQWGGALAVAAAMSPAHPHR